MRGAYFNAHQQIRQRFTFDNSGLKAEKPNHAPLNKLISTGSHFGQISDSFGKMSLSRFRHFVTS